MIQSLMQAPTKVKASLPCQIKTSNLVSSISLSSSSSIASSSSNSPATVPSQPFQLITGGNVCTTLTSKPSSSAVASPSTSTPAPKIILASDSHIKLTTATTLTSPRIITTQSVTVPTTRVITAAQLPANLTIHQIALSHHGNAVPVPPPIVPASTSPPPMQNAQIIVTATNSGGVAKSVGSGPVAVPMASKINETLNKPAPTTAQILIDSAKLKGAPGLSFVRPNKGTTTCAMSTNVHLSEAQSAAKIAQANLISIINTGSSASGNSANLMPQVTSILSQFQSQSNAVNRPVVAQPPLQVSSQPSPSSSPLKPNIIRKTKPQLESSQRESNMTAATQNPVTAATTQEILVKEISKFPTFELYANSSSTSGTSTTFSPMFIGDTSKQLLKQPINLDCDSNVVVDLRQLMSNFKTQQQSQSSESVKISSLSIANGQSLANSILITQQPASIKSGTSSKKIVNISKCATPPPPVPLATAPQPLATTQLNALTIVDNIKSEPSETKLNPIKPKSKRKQEFKKTTDMVNAANSLTLALSNASKTVKSELVKSEVNDEHDENLIGGENEYEEEPSDMHLNNVDKDEDEEIDEDDSEPPPLKITRLNNQKCVNKKSSANHEPIRKSANKYLSSMVNGKIGGKSQTIKNITKIGSNAPQNVFSSYCLDDETVKQLSNEFVYEDKYGVRWVAAKTKPQLTLSKFYKPTWKSRSNHFDHYSDIKIRDDCKNLDELHGEQQRLEDLNEWRFHYVISQFQDLVNCENDSLSLIGEIESLVKTHCNINDFCEKIQDCIKANSQRHKYVCEELNEAQMLIENIIQHKTKFKEILNVTSATAVSNAKKETNSNNSTQVAITSATNESGKKAVANTSKVRNGSVNNSSSSSCSSSATSSSSRLNRVC